MLNPFKKAVGDAGTGFILPAGDQIKAWVRADRKIAFMAFADYDVAPYGFGDFFDALQMFCSNNTLGLGIGHVDQVYPLFGIPTHRS